MSFKKIFPQDREEQIEYILDRLNTLKETSESNKYAIEQNKLFFEAIQSVPKYLKWMYKTRKSINSSELLEINELLPELNEEFHQAMADMERQKRPGIIQPIVDFIYKLFLETKGNKRFRVASFGAGSMEAERQSIEQMHEHGIEKPITIVGFDSSSNTRKFAEKNMSSLPYVRVVMEDYLTEDKMLALESETSKQVLVIIAGNDIFLIEKDFQPYTFLLVMTALFLHHIDALSRAELVNKMRAYAKNTLNYDGYKNEIVVPIISMAGWKKPVFLNAAVFSSVRFPSKKEAVSLHKGSKISFYKHGHYRAIFSLNKI